MYRKMLFLYIDHGMVIYYSSGFFRPAKVMPYKKCLIATTPTYTISICKKVLCWVYNPRLAKCFA